MVRCRASLHSNTSGGNFEKTNHLRPAEFTPKNHTALGVHTGNLENMLSRSVPIVITCGGLLLSVDVQ
jgi:hypothetical protein